MKDRDIVDCFWERSETALAETQKKYGNYCYAIAFRILNSVPDAEECTNDTYVAAWNAMPPHRPTNLSTFLGKLARNLALNRYIHDHAKKRPHHLDSIFEELEAVLPSGDGEDPVADKVILKCLINRFLSGLPKQTRMLFVRRYWYLDSIDEMATKFGMTETNVKVTLFRTRNKLKDFLEKEDISL